MTGGEPAAGEVREAVPFEPDHLVDDLDLQNLQREVDQADVVVGPVDPEGAGRPHNAADLGKPGQGERQIIGQRQVVPAGHHFGPITAEPGQGRQFFHCQTPPLLAL